VILGAQSKTNPGSKQKRTEVYEGLPPGSILRPPYVSRLEGQSGNPSGRPKGARNRLGEEFLAELYNAFVANGRPAIVRVVEEDPAAFLRIIASLVPKEVKSPSSPFDALTEEELELASWVCLRTIRGSLLLRRKLSQGDRRQGAEKNLSNGRSPDREIAGQLR
jgi:Family of unknown function (DUF5681)